MAHTPAPPLLTRVAQASVPDKLDFSELFLERDAASGDIRFAWEPLERICATNDLDAASLRGNLDLSLALIRRWYAVHLARGGAHDAFADDLDSVTSQQVTSLSRPVDASGIHSSDY